MKHTLSTIALALLSYCALAQSKQTVQFDSLFTVLHQQKKFNGNVLIADNGEVIFQKSYGLANEATQQKLNDSSIFELASVSKQFTAMGIVILQKQGKLKYDDAISRYIPELKFYDTITIRQLLVHTSGLPDYMDLLDKHWDKAKFATNQDIVNQLAKHQPALDFKPGEQFEYSNTGYALLALIIEKVSQQSYGGFLNTHIFQPLGMKNTFVYRSRYEPKTIENYALGYVHDSLGNKVLINSFGKDFYAYYLDGIVGDGMVNSTAADLLIWDRALYSNQLVNNSDKAEIFASITTKNGKDTNYGFGWMIGKNEKYGTIVGHSGGWAGYVNYIERHIDNDKTVILLQNNATRSTIIPKKEVRQILYHEPLITEQLKPVQLTTRQLESYVGTYINKDIPMKINVWIKDSNLIAQAEGQASITLQAFDKHTFKYNEADIKMVFDLNSATFILYQGKNELTFKKSQQ